MRPGRLLTMGHLGVREETDADRELARRHRLAEHAFASLYAAGARWAAGEGLP